MRDTAVNWLNARYAVDVQYCHIDDAPLLANLIRRHGLFWDGQFCYRIGGKAFIKKFPEWRTDVKVPMERVKKVDPSQTKLDIK